MSTALQRRGRGAARHAAHRHPRAATLDGLTAACDAYVSLHRSEGLGLPLIEAMYLGKPVIATGYGGVTDFLDDETGFVVHHRLATLQRSHGPYPAGAVWAEPDIAHAAALMRALADAPEIAAARIAAARRRVTELYVLRRRRRAHPAGARAHPPGEAGRRVNGAGSLAFQIAGRVLRAEGMAGLRERISDRLRESLRRRSFRATASASGLPPIPVLNLLPTAPTPRLGGMQAQLLTRIEDEAEHRPVALLYPETKGYRLEVAAGGRRLALGLEKAPPPSPVILRDAAFERAVARAAAEVGARALHVEGLAGIPLGSLLELHRSGLALVLSVHDFSLFCPRPHLLERPQLRFCGYSRDRERCARCLAQDWPVGLRFQDERRAIARELLLAAAAVVYPSEFLRDRHLELFPGLPPDRQRVIEPAGPPRGEAAERRAGARCATSPTSARCSRTRGRWCSRKWCAGCRRRTIRTSVAAPTAAATRRCCTACAGSPACGSTATTARDRWSTACGATASTSPCCCRSSRSPTAWRSRNAWRRGCRWSPSITARSPSGSAAMAAACWSLRRPGRRESPPCWPR